ncbi:MAG: two-component sensor histidine kinase [Streptosporangiales bacterium]|nr:two-component sensor histidine kinase [Streptosporangiales bacterium]
MEPELIAGIVGLVGLATGVAAGLAFRVSEGGMERTTVSPPVQPELPPGAADVLSALPSSAVVIDSSDRVIRASSAARAFGMVREDRLVVTELLALARRVRRDGEVRETEIEIAAGRFGPEATSFAVRVAPLGSTGLVLVLAEDQSERRRVEAVRRDFVANVSHELKTPVGALSLLAETVEGAADDSEAVRRFAGRMQQEASRLTALIQDLITLSRIQGAEPMAEPAPVALDEAIGEALDACRLKADAKHITLAAGGERGVSVLGDDDMLVTALRNLVDNAVGYSPEHTKVAVSVRTADGMAEVSVTDQGIGIPQYELERIFERFYRVDSARSRATGGTGLGLAIVKHVATNHRGEVTVWSKEGSGSTFTLRLPVAGSTPLGPGTNTVREATQ